MSHPRVIVCAAVKLRDGLVICGVRYFDQIMRDVIDSVGDHSKILHGAEEGFVDNNYRYLDRNAAWKVAETAGQIKRDDNIVEGRLHSENLW